ncbi:MAG: HAMP domain-containing sensor histidine kinase [Anaerolineaceae bacterium]
MKKWNTLKLGTLNILFAIIVFVVLLITMAIIAFVTVSLFRFGILTRIEQPNILMPVAVLAVSSILIGTVLSMIIGRSPMRRIDQFIKALNSLAKGHYETRIDLGKRSIMGELTDSFNTLASELQNTEMLRSDFVDNFSHEFKTPIVSIRGFAKLLKRKDLSDEQRSEFIDIIINESSRLAELSTNVLNLTKVENQNILTDVKQVNISEQIRTSIMLLEKKWTDKDLYISAEFDEFYCPADEELLKQVWINILDNAIKFADDKGLVEVNIQQDQNTLTVSIKNTGSEISTETQKRIFDKFYQGDTSHSSEGIGVGLAISKKIIDLHNGTIEVSSGPNHVVFSVKLPIA